MPDVIIKGMEMPERCCECQFIKCGVGDWKGEFWCSAIRFEPLTNIDTRPDWCPLRPAPGWISVEERLPEAAGNYIVAYHPCYWDDVKYQVTNVGIDAFRGKTTWAKNKHRRVTHWMPLPEPPVGGDGDDD